MLLVIRGKYFQKFLAKAAGGDLLSELIEASEKLRAAELSPIIRKRIASTTKELTERYEAALEQARFDLFHLRYRHFNCAI